MSSSSLFFEGVAPPMITRLGRLPRSVHAAPSNRDEESDAFFDALLTAAGLTPTAYRARTLHRRLAACLRFLQVGSVAAARQRLVDEPGLTRALLNVALLGVSEFFRDTCVFERIERTVLPALADRFDRLRIWSAGCSGGRELYSVAMLLAEAGMLSKSELLGTDCRAHAIEEARTAVFPWTQVSALPAVRQERFFTQAGQAGIVRPALRLAVTWKPGDLLTGVQPGPWQLILWRNVAIYLEADTVSQVWNSLIAELAPGGYLIVGKADHPPAQPDLTRVSSCIYQKSGGPR
jgi:chemotaxis methyl-accepting protein methylase